MRNRSSQSLILKVVVFQLLLFALAFLIISLFQTHLQLMQVFFFLFLAIFIFSTYFAYDISRSIRTISRDIDRISDGDYSIQSDEGRASEIEELSSKVAKLGETIQTSQDSLENQHNQLNGILAYMTDGVIATDRRGLVILANTAALHLLHTTRENILRQNIAESLKIDNYYAFRDLLEQTPEVSIDSENTYGEYVRLKVNFSIFRRESGYISGIVAVLHDVTDSERAERERRLFVSNVSHELRTPLTTIKSYLETLNDGALRDPDLAPGFVETSLTETNHMIHMISDLLELSRIDQGRFTLEKEMVNIVAFLAHTLARYDQILSPEEKEKLTITPHLPLHPIWLEIDPDKFGQVIDNILTNAIKYSPDGGVIRIGLEATEQQVIITISDEGMGIPPVDLPKIFDRFYRVDKARSHDAGGTGLGLSIAYDIVKLHDGYIWARSDGNHGTTFTIALPYTPVDYSDEEWNTQDMGDLKGQLAQELNQQKENHD
ncbi:MAG: PAS domain-containing protein [Streptococcaceae bacterium]|jgi:two-component system sensor histidine kinase VicK|nr:PAS domain-containing protein [Streptococcaceae bacterium]